MPCYDKKLEAVRPNSELMRSFNLTEAEEAAGCWSDERLINHFMLVHFKYQSDVGDLAIT